MNSDKSSKLFACSKCFTRHPYEELSAGQQICLKCQGNCVLKKCTYCRSEFQQTAKTGSSSICKKCEQNVKQHGRPGACQYCNIIAAFIGNKCQRCANSEQKYGPPISCEQCKLKCAFDRKGDDDRIDGKLCWLCTLSFKRTLAKSKQSDPEARSQSSVSSKSKDKKFKNYHSKRPNRPDVTKASIEEKYKDDMSSTAAKMPRLSSNNHKLADVIDPNSSDHMIAMTQLKEKNATLQKQLSTKDALLLSKEKMITELKAKQFEAEKEFRKKLKDQEDSTEKQVESMMVKIRKCQKEIATLSKGAKKNLNSSTKVKESNESGTDSPSTT